MTTLVYRGPAPLPAVPPPAEPPRRRAVWRRLRLRWHVVTLPGAREILRPRNLIFVLKALKG